MARVRERYIEAKFRLFCKKKGWLCIKNKGYAGMPDRMVLMPEGRVFFVELKSEKGKLSPMQNNMIKRLHSMSFKCYVINNTSDFKEIDYEINKNAD